MILYKGNFKKMTYYYLVSQGKISQGKIVRVDEHLDRFETIDEHLDRFETIRETYEQVKTGQLEYIDHIVKPSDNKMVEFDRLDDLLDLFPEQFV